MVKQLPKPSETTSVRRTRGVRRSPDRFGREGVTVRVDGPETTGVSRGVPPLVKRSLDNYEDDRFVVKFADEYRVRLRDCRPVVTGVGDRDVKLRHAVESGQALRETVRLLGENATIGDLTRAEWSELGDETRAVFEELDGSWRRLHTVPEETLAAWVTEANAVLDEPVPDFDSYLVLLLPESTDVVAVTERLGALEEVEYARPLPRPAPSPQVPDFTDAANPTGVTQRYLGPAGSNGVDAQYAWTVPGGDGAEISICDVEYAWHFSHDDVEDNGGISLVGPQGLDLFDEGNHGTAVVGIYGGDDDQMGVRGIAFESRKLAAASVTGFPVPWWNVPAAITNAMEALQRGDVILLEQHMPGPNSDPVDALGGAQDGFVPVEWEEPVYQTIRLAVGLGYVVVEAAGNGGEDLDADIYAQGHAPFDPANDSGAILVGAGSPADRSRLGFSNFGARVDVQGWGRSVVTATGPGTAGPTADLWNVDGSDLLYTQSFSGTSSASAMIAGVCASLQGAFLQAMGRTATPAELRELLLVGASVQTGDTTENIGPLPNLRGAIDAVLDNVPGGPTETFHEVVTEAEGVNDTGILFEQGDDVHITATGEIWAGVWLTGTNGPNGWEGTDDHPKFPLSGSHPYCLLHKVVPEGENEGDVPWTFTGDGTGFTCDDSEPGRLVLAINDDVYANGSGQFDCTVTVQRA